MIKGRHEKEDGRRPMWRKRPHLLRDILALVGAAALLYLFITEVVMRVLAWLTPSGGI